MAEIPESAISERFLAGSGPGGQNVNKVATACQLRVDVYALGLPPDAFRRLKTLAGSKLTSEGGLVILARRFRTQEANRADARNRLSELIDAALTRPERRIKTKPSKAAKARRAEGKKARSAVKAMRGRVRGAE
ncbi:aminoacyl-tRNA hydrolase [Sphingopyxis sp. XHP0097]|uniref:Aminoacyl-tRNA hydrolase n=1 Tax=Sphingopyxis jiangsuensis TaxID=2871171 RepID=A0ABS7MA04_9SPHN|nr:MULTISPECIES: alternative ribosome rescue aminoacyl-tRNA hydrolase ArfB [Sphingopyxis]MBL0768471.1 aminoacyl-tRNA hydrolase [Sphingopyxis lutea]MBY4635814.1 aminoacyl-tRNA hydrolase [Sphingopyxis jiangsuensis]